jgi:hypothetical protein
VGAGDSAPNLTQTEALWGTDPDAAPRGWTVALPALTFWIGMGPEQSMLALDIDPRTNIAGDKLMAVLHFPRSKPGPNVATRPIPGR